MLKHHATDPDFMYFSCNTVTSFEYISHWYLPCYLEILNRVQLLFEIPFLSARFNKARRSQNFFLVTGLLQIVV